MFDQQKRMPDAADIFAATPPNRRAATALSPGSQAASSQPGANPNATHPASWAAQLNASLFDDDVATLAPEQRAKREALDRLRKDYLEAKASDGMLDQLAGDGLRQRAHELGTDRMSFADSMYARGMDPAQVHALLEKLRGVDSSKPTDAAAEHRDHNLKPLAAASSLSAGEMKLWREAMATRFDDMHAGYTTDKGAALPPTPMEKLIDDKQSNTLATGVYDDKGIGKQVSPTVGGFIGMASHSGGLPSTGRLQMAGLDSSYHAGLGWFDETTNQWPSKVAGPQGAASTSSAFQRALTSSTTPRCRWAARPTTTSSKRPHGFTRPAASRPLPASASTSLGSST